jgi:hypothetical protein
MATAACLQVTEVEVSKVKMNSSLRYALTGAAMGLIFGFIVAAATGNAIGRWTAPDSATANPSPVTLNVPKPAPVAPIQAAQKQAEKASGTSLVTPIHMSMIALPATSAPKTVSVHRGTQETGSEMTASIVQTSEGFSIATANSIVPRSVEAALLVAADKSFSFSVEGDMNIADYDASTGRIETNSGKSFTVDKTTSDAMPLQDYSGNVHYRCNQGGSCTLMGNGVSVPNVRLTT